MGLPLTSDEWQPGRIHTPRLVLRPPRAGDREAFVDLATDAEVNRHLGGPRDRAELERAMPEVPADQPGQLVAEHDGRFVAWVGLSRREPSRPGRFGAGGRDLELSYVLPVAAWGHGYAAEACAAVLARAEEWLGEPVVLCTQVANTRSVTLARRLGFAEVERFEEFGAEQWFGVRHAALRRATPADAQVLADIAEAAYSPYVERMGGLRPGPMSTDHAAAIEETEAWVALADGSVVGYLLLVAEDGCLLLDDVAVHPAHHGRGTGRRLLDLAESRARAHGLHRIRLYTHVTMVENQELYARRGYVETHRATDDGLTRVFLEKIIEAVET